MEKKEKKEKTLILTLRILIIVFAGILIFLLLPLFEKVKKVPSMLERTEVMEMRKEENEGQIDENTISVTLSDISAKTGVEGSVSVGGSRKNTASNADYIIPDSDTRRLTAADLSGLTKEQLAIARNEIFARHGRIFQEAPFPDYFNSKSWYQGTVPPEEFDANMDSRISEIEKSNVELIKSYE